jgi:hypothetical protein
MKSIELSADKEKSMTKLDAEHIRLERAYRRLGTRHPACVACGESYAHALELHHIGEQAHHDYLSIVCRNCHRKLTDAQQDRQAVVAQTPTNETIGRYLYGLADIFRMIAGALTQFARHLLGLDDDEARTT